MRDNDKLPPEAQAWLRAHTDEDATSLERVWRLVGKATAAPPAFKPDPDRVQAMERRIAAVTQPGASAETRDRPPVRRRRSSAVRRAGYATAVLLAVLAIGLGWWLRPITVQAPIGEQATAALPDGSTVELNSGSRLVYRRALFGRQPFGPRARRVRLEGEAFFDVAAAETPFVVATFNSNVTVLGTCFNVRAWTDTPDASTSVILTEGHLLVTAMQDAEHAEVTLRPGEMTRVAAGQHPTVPTKVAVQEALAWRTGGLSFTEAPLEAILDEVERRTGVSIEIASEAIRDARLSLLVERVDGAEAILEMIAQAHGLAYHRTDEGYVLTDPDRP